MILLLCTLSWGQSLPGSQGYEPPALGADLFRPSTDSQHGLQIEDTHAPEAFHAGLTTWWVRDPLTWYNLDGERLPIVGNAMAVAATAAWGLGPLRFGVVAPAYLYTSGLAGARGSTLGDPSLDLRVARSRQGLGLAAGARVLAPLGASEKQLGQNGWSYEALAIADYSADRFWVGANLGVRGLPKVELIDVALNDQLLYRVGAAWTPTGPWSVAAEMQGFATWSALRSGEAVGNPREILISGSRAHNDRKITLGLGVGQGAGIGAPKWRLVLGVGAQSPPDLAQTSSAP